jgi:hypothetical protein
MGIVDDLNKELASARAIRLPYECDWSDYVRYTAPDMERGFTYPANVANTGMHAWQASASRRRSTTIYDTTAVWLLDRLVNGCEALAFPRGAHWHGTGFDDPFAPEPSQVDEEFFDLLTDYLFRARYSSKSGFGRANRACTASAVKLGTGIASIDESKQLWDVNTPLKYRYLPLYEMFLIVDGEGNDCGFFRERSLEAWQVAKIYGDGASAEVKKDASDPTRKANKINIIQAVFLRDGGVPGAVDRKRMQYESVHYESATKHICKRDGYAEYPLIVRRWDRDGLSPYGSPPQAKLMGDIKSLQQLSKDDLQASAAAVRPPVGVHKVERPLNLNPGAVNPGMIDAQGRPLYRSMVDLQNPGAANEKAGELRERLRIALYGDLWQTLLEGNGRTATESTIRKQEMADQIGPFTTNLQEPNAVMFDREVGILGRRGAFEAGSPLEPPESVAAFSISVRSTSPIDKMREAGSFESLMGFKQYQAMAAQTNPGAVDWTDEQEERELAQKSLGLPAKLLRPWDDIVKGREQRAEQQAQAEQLAQGESMARMAKDATPALQALQQGGGL